MNFDELDKKMRIFETAADLCVLPGITMVARLDGRSFTRLTKEVCQFEAPFDVRFRDLMVATTESLMTCGFRVLYAYTESDEISLLFDPAERLFGRKLRKYNSTLAGEASAQLSVRLGQVATFDCRISQLPTPELVVDYFRWRNEDAARNALSAWCYWTLRKDSLNEQQATKRLLGASVSQKNELLFQYGINFNDLPNWQKRGVGLYWEEYEKPSINPVTNVEVTALRRRVRIDFDLPMKGEYGQFVRSMLPSERSHPVPELAPILLILDIDETLLYASEKRLEKEPDSRVGPYFIYVRPYLQEFLQCCNEHFRLAVWSSSSSDYLNAIVTEILPKGLKLEFVWSRERCIQRFDGEVQEFYYVKDLRKVQRMGFDLDRILIVDDTPKKVERNFGNAIYAKPYFGDPEDSELRELSRYLKSMAALANIRSVEKRGWRNNCSTKD